MINSFSSSKNPANDTSPNNSSSNDTNSDFNTVFENIKNFSDSSSNNNSNIDMATIMKLKSIIDKVNSNKNDPRTNLLLSLKPYLKPSRKEKVDQYIKIFSMTQILEDFNFSGGENTK